jgi:hypothetical protein
MCAFFVLCHTTYSFCEKYSPFRPTQPQPSGYRQHGGTGKNCDKDGNSVTEQHQQQQQQHATRPTTNVGARVPTLRVCAWNIGRGFFAKEAEIADIAKNEHLDIISISEADQMYQLNPPTIKGFKTIPTLRSGPLQKVRVLTLVKDSLFSQVKVRTDLMSENFPSTWIEINGLLPCQFYREWAEPQGEKLDILLDQIITASSSKKSLVVMGDCNIDQEKWDNTSYQHFKLSEQLRNGLALGGLEVLLMGRTYSANHMSTNGSFASSALDHVYCSTTKTIRTKVLQSSASDHLLIMVEIDLDAKNSKEATKKMSTLTRRTFKSFSSEAFKYDLLQQRLESIPECGGVDDMVEALESMITSVLDIHAPFREVKQRTAFKSGLSRETKAMMKQKDKLNSKMKQLHGDQKLSMHLEYKKARNRCRTLHGGRGGRTTMSV